MAFVFSPLSLLQSLKAQTDYPDRVRCQVDVNRTECMQAVFFESDAWEKSLSLKTRRVCGRMVIFFLLRCRSVCSSLQSLDLGFYIRRASLRGVCFHGANTVKGSDCKGGCCWEVGCCEQHVPKCCSSGACMFVPYRENACGNALSNDEDSPSQKGQIKVVRQRHFAQATNGPYCYGFVSTYARSRVSFRCSRISVRG